MSDWFNCTKCAEHVHSRFLARPDVFFTGCVHEWRVACRVPINLFAIGGRAVRQHFGAYTREQYVDEPYLTALLTERTGLPSLLVSDAVAVHLSFGFQHMADERRVLESYRELARDAALHERLRRDYGARALSRSCPGAAPAALMQGRRQPPPPERPWGSGGLARGGGGGRAGRGRGGGAQVKSTAGLRGGRGSAAGVTQGQKVLQTGRDR